MDLRKRKFFVCLTTFFINGYFILIMNNIINIRSIVKIFISCILLFILFIFIGAKDRIELNKSQFKNLFLWFLFITINIISSCINKSTNIIVSIPMLLILLLWLYSQDNILNYAKEISLGSVLSLLLLLILNILNVPITDGQYFSILQSPIGLCMYITTLLPFLFYLYNCISRKEIKFLLLFFCLINISYIIYSGSRTGIITLVAILLIWLVYYFNISLKKYTVFPKLLLFIICAFGVISNFSILHNNIYYTINSRYEVDTPESSEVPSNDINNTQVESIEDENTDSDEKENLEKFTDRIEIANKDLNTFSAGRIDIWKEYLSNLNLFGHKDISEISVIVNYKDKEFTSISAHNTFIQVLYDYGIISGIIFISIIFINIYRNAKEVKEDKKNINNYLLLSLIINFVFIALFNSTYYFYNYINMFYFLLFVNPYLLKNR